MSRSSTEDPAVAGPPGAGEIEISIFGPGKGECVAVHVGAGDWIVVDSCLDQLTREQPALRYLDSIGVAVETQVKVVVATHAHDDHIAGISRIYEAASQSILVVSSASTSEEFFASLSADAEIEALLRKSIRNEYRELFAIAEARAKNRGGWRPMKRAVEGLELWTRSASDGFVLATLRSLSPSHHAVSRAQASLARGTAQVGDRRRLAAADPNEFAVALWIQIGERAVLLGADLLAGPAACGWQAVVKTFNPPNRADYFKVPHHGAPNAHYDGIWSQFLGEAPIATLAPYRAGVTARPSTSDIERLKSLTPNLYATASPRRPAPARGVRRTAAALTQVATNVRDPWGISGHARTRGPIGEGSWWTEVFPPALRL